MAASFRRAVATDAALVYRLLREFAADVSLEETFDATIEMISTNLLSQPHAMVFLMERDAAAAAQHQGGDIDVLLTSLGRELLGLCTLEQHFSTFKGRPYLFIEDLYIRERYRKQGYGTQMLHFIMQLAAERSMARVEWQVVRWNTGAAQFYQKMGATIDERWLVVRVEGEQLHKLVSSSEEGAGIAHAQ